MQKYSVFHKKSKAKFKILYIMYNTKEDPLKKQGGSAQWLRILICM